jgi:anti-sigma regulatory factor (Ser/Thr protein kinase)
MRVMKRESWLPAAPESEAVANAVRHGSACGDPVRGVLLIVEIDEDAISIEVCDCGSFDAELRPAAQDDIGGRGIPIIAALADSFELVPEPDRTRVRFGKRLPVAV